MLLCDGCDQGSTCGALVCLDAARPQAPGTGSNYLATRPRREGPWRSRLAPVYDYYYYYYCYYLVFNNKRDSRLAGVGGHAS